jgi:hypothetical protein
MGRKMNFLLGSVACKDNKGVQVWMAQRCFDWRSGTVREPRGEGTSTAGNRYQKNCEDSWLRKIKCVQ